LKHIRYSNLNSRQREIFNFQKVAAILADYGFNCIKLADDWQGADFLAYHIDGNNTLRVQLKGRLSIDRKYVGKNLFMAFPSKNSWYLVEHDRLVELVSAHANWLNTTSWIDKGIYNSDAPNRLLMNALEDFKLEPYSSSTLEIEEAEQAVDGNPH
jgi:hypothetical protein